MSHYNFYFGREAPMSYRHDLNQNFNFATNIATSDSTTSLQASPGAGNQLVLQVLTVVITTAAAQSFTIGDGTITVFSAPASLAVGTYGVDLGPYGKPLTAATALSFTPAGTGVGATLSGFGYIRSTTTG